MFFQNCLGGGVPEQRDRGLEDGDSSDENGNLSFPSEQTAPPEEANHVVVTMRNNKMTSSPASPASPDDHYPEISVTVTPPANGNNGNNVNLWLAVGMLLLGYVLGSQQDKLQPLPYILETYLVTGFAMLVVVYLSVRVVAETCSYLLPKRPAKKLKTKQPKRQLPVVVDGETPAPVAPPGEQNFSGSFQLVENNNFEELLAVQGVPWALRGAANKLRPIHHFDHCLTQAKLTIKIEGIIESTTNYMIGGPPTQCEVRGRKFEDTLTYIPGGVQTIKRALEQQYTLQVRREWNADQSALIMTSKITFDDESKASVTAIQKFERMVDNED